MAKEIIDAVKAAELKAAEEISQSKADAASMIKTAREAAKKEHDELLKRAEQEAQARRKEAEAKALEIVAEAEQFAVKAASELKASVGDKEKEAIRAVISSLLDK